MPTPTFSIPVWIENKPTNVLQVCASCGEKLIKGKKRLSATTGEYHNHRKFSYWHIDCFAKELTALINLNK